WLKTTTLMEFLRIRQDVLLAFMGAIEEAGSALALPTQSLRVKPRGEGRPSTQNADPLEPLLARAAHREHRRLSRLRCVRAAMDRAHRFERVGLIGRFVGAIAEDAREAEGEAGGIVRALLHAVEGDFDDHLGAEMDDVALAPYRELFELLGLPGEHGVGHALEGLAEHGKAPALGIARAEVDVAEEARAAAAAPFDGEHDEIEGVSDLDFEPLGGAAPRFVRGVGLLGEHAFVARGERALEEPIGLRGVDDHDARHTRGLRDALDERSVAL